MRILFFVFLPVAFLISCEGGTVDPVDPPELSVADGLTFERAGNSSIIFEIRADANASTDIEVTYQVNGKSATPDVDFTSNSGTVTIPAGSNKASVTVEILDDELKEVDEKIELELVSATNATLFDKFGIGLIQDNDVSSNYITDGYAVPDEHYGY